MLLAIRFVRKEQDPVLRQEAKLVTRFDDVLAKLLDDMQETMYHYNGIGLAAPQIGIAKRIVVIAHEDDEVLELVNPEIIVAEGEEIDVEGCLSLPGIYGEVSRAAEVTVKYQDRNGNFCEVSGSGLLARVLQHEFDHLQGVLFTDKAIRLLPEEDVVEETMS